MFEFIRRVCNVHISMLYDFGELLTYVVTAAGSRPTCRLSTEHVIVVDFQLCRYCHKTSYHIQLHSGARVEQFRRSVCYDVIPGTNSWQRQNVCCCPPRPDGLWGPPYIVVDRYPCGFFVSRAKVGMRGNILSLYHVC